MKKHTGRKILIIVLVLALIAGAVWAFAINGTADNRGIYTAVTAQTRDIVTYYTFSGNLEGGEATVQVARSGGTVDSILLHEGELVEEDDEVLKLESGTKVKSTADGIITDIYVDEGDKYSYGAQLFRVVDFAEPTIRIKVDEYDIASIKNGQEATVTVQATGEVLTGKVTHVSQQPTTSGDVTYYTATVAVPYADSLHIGMTCEVKILRKSATNATALPVSAVKYDENGNAYVYVLSGNQYIRQSITVGINNGTWVEITSGVHSGETVYTYSTVYEAMMSASGN